jgi:ABC-2 type transport system ATP-binding protein
MTAIDVDGATKLFGEVVAVSNLSFQVEEGEVFGFLGPNGAGKSTTINMMLDFVRPDSGTLTVLGHDAHTESVAVRERTGVLPEGFELYDRLTGREHMEFAIESKEADDDPMELMERTGIADAADRKAGDYSTGMAQRLALAMALVDDPDLLVLDEPTTGLDPSGAREMRELVREEADRGATVFFSSHILGQVEAVCDRVGILRDGEMVAVDSIEGLRAAAGGGDSLVVTVDAASDDDLDAVRAVDGVTAAETDGGTVRVGLDGAPKTDVIAALEDAGVEINDFETEEASLEDLFVSYTEDGQEVEA